MAKNCDVCSLKDDCEYSMPLTRRPVDCPFKNVKSDKAKEAIAIADKVSDLIVFHRRVRRNGDRMMRTVEE